MFIQGQRKGSIILKGFASIMITFLELRGSNDPPGNPGSAVPGIASNAMVPWNIRKDKNTIYL